MARRQIDIRFKGKGLGPGSVRVKDVARVLLSLDEAVQAVAKKENLDLGESGGLCLTSIREGSVDVRLQSTVGRVVFDAFDDFTYELNAVTRESPQEVVRSRREVAKFCTAYQCRAEFRGKASQSKPDVVIYPDSPEGENVATTVRGVTTIRGIIEDTGGATPKAWIRLHYGRVPISLSKDQAMDLGKLLYRKVQLEGVATWDIETKAIVDFRLHSFTGPYEDVSPVEAFEALSREFGHLFEDRAE